MAFDPNHQVKIAPIDDADINSNDLNPSTQSRVAQENGDVSIGQGIAQQIQTSSHYIWPPTKDLFRFKTFSEEDIKLRAEWKVGSQVLVYSRGTEQYHVGQIDEIFVKEETGQEWMSVGYNGKHKELQRWCKSVIPLKAGFVLHQRYPQQFGDVTVKEFVQVIGWEENQWMELLKQAEKETQEELAKLEKLEKNHEMLKDNYKELQGDYDALKKETEFYKKAYEQKKNGDKQENAPLTMEEMKAIYGDSNGNGGSDAESVSDEPAN